MTFLFLETIVLNELVSRSYVMETTNRPQDLDTRLLKLYTLPPYPFWYFGVSKSKTFGGTTFVSIVTVKLEGTCFVFGVKDK